jgi:hypothetical protein
MNITISRGMTKEQNFLMLYLQCHGLLQRFAFTWMCDVVGLVGKHLFEELYQTAIQDIDFGAGRFIVQMPTDTPFLAEESERSIGFVDEVEQFETITNLVKYNGVTSLDGSNVYIKLTNLNWKALRDAGLLIVATDGENDSNDTIFVDKQGDQAAKNLIAELYTPVIPE